MRKNFAMTSLLGASLILGGSPASAGRVGPGYEISWGKAGVSLEDYWIDSSECAHQAAAIDLTGTNPARALVIASRMMDNQNDFGDIQWAVRLAAPEIQWNRAATILRDGLEQCLTERGYVKFKLTKGQARHLKKLEAGSLERRQYLHGLASDSAVLKAQALADS
jgi:hypothetical protein